MKRFIAASAIVVLTIFVQCVFAQDKESYTNVANQLVDLINAADYSGVEKLFNKDMSAALPLDKATQFFTQMSAQFGKIQKVNEPKNKAGWTVFPIDCE